MATDQDKLNALVRAATDASLALGKIAAADGAQPGHVAYLPKTAMADIADRAQAALDDAIIITCRPVSA